MMGLFRIIPIILLFASCSKMEEIVPVKETKKHTELHVRTVKSASLIIVDEKVKEVSCDTECLNVVYIENAKSVSIINIGLGGVNAVIKDYISEQTINYGNIKGFLKIK